MNALFTACCFPPIGGAGTQRSVKFVKYFADFAVHPIVATSYGPTGSRWEPEDVSLVDDVPPSVPVLRATEQAPSHGSSIESWVSQIDELGREAAALHNPSVILVTLAPYQGLLPALTLGAQLGLPVVADLRDPRALDELRHYRSWLHRLRDRQAMGAALERCARVVMNTEEAARAALESFSELHPNRVTVLPSGFDKDDFRTRVPERDDDSFQIVHTGCLHTTPMNAKRSRRLIDRSFGGSMWSVNRETRSHVYLLSAPEKLAKDDPALAERTEVVLAGILEDNHRMVVDMSPVGRHVRQLGYLGHSEAVELMMSADVLFLPLHDIPDGRRSRIVPGKTYEYLASGSPIIAAVPPGDARDLIDRSGAGITVSPTDAIGIAQAIQDIAGRSSDFRVDPTILAPFERRHQTRELAAVLHQAALDPLPRP